MGVNSSSTSDSDSSDSSVYLSAEEGNRNSGSPENRNVPVGADNESREPEINVPSTEDATSDETRRRRDERTIRNGDNNTSDTRGTGLLNVLVSTSSSSDPSMTRPQEISRKNESAASMAIEAPKKDFDPCESASNRSRESKRIAIEAACQTARKRNETRHANGIPRPNRALAPIPSFRGQSAARATSEGLSENQSNGKISEVSAKKQPTDPLSPAPPEGSNTDAKDDGALPITGDVSSPDNLSPEKACTLSALAPEFIPIRTYLRSYHKPSHLLPPLTHPYSALSVRKVRKQRQRDPLALGPSTRLRARLLLRSRHQHDRRRRASPARARAARHHSFRATVRAHIHRINELPAPHPRRIQSRAAQGLVHGVPHGRVFTRRARRAAVLLHMHQPMVNYFASLLHHPQHAARVVRAHCAPLSAPARLGLPRHPSRGHGVSG